MSSTIRSNGARGPGRGWRLGLSDDDMRAAAQLKHRQFVHASRSDAGRPFRASAQRRQHRRRSGAHGRRRPAALGRLCLTWLPPPASSLHGQPWDENATRLRSEGREVHRASQPFSLTRPLSRATVLDMAVAALRGRAGLRILHRELPRRTDLVIIPARHRFIPAKVVSP